jgi:putative flippase GtrA
VAHNFHAPSVFLTSILHRYHLLNAVRELDNVHIVSHNSIGFVVVAVEKYLLDGFFTKHHGSLLV